MREDYLISEPPLRALAVFAAPMILGNLFQQTYTMADSAIVGRFVGEQALGAVGASMALTNIFICVAIGGGNGASVIVSRLFGGRKIGPMKAAVYTALTAFLALSVLLGGFGLWMDRRILLALNTPADVMDMAVTYLDIYFLGLPFLFMYNVLSSMFNALGRSRIPLGFLIFSSVFNVILDWVAVAHLHMGVAGAAWATLIAQGVSALLSFGVLLRLLGRMEGAGRRFAPDQLLPMARIALPSILQQSTVSIGMMLVQSVVNSFGSQALAGFSAGMRIESMCVVPMSGIGNAVATFTAQNMGADRQERVVQGWRASLKLVALCAAVICLILEPADHRPVPGRGQLPPGPFHWAGLPGLPGVVLRPHRAEDGGGRPAPGRGGHAGVHPGEPSEPVHPGGDRQGHGPPAGHRLGVVRHPRGLGRELYHLLRPVPDGPLAGDGHGKARPVTGTDKS